MARISYNATTNSQGVANANITGQGLGKLKFIGKVDDIWSNTIEIDDYLFYDKAVTGQKNTNWTSIRLDAVTDETGTVLTANGNYAHYMVINSSQRFSVPLAVEFDVLETSYTTSKPSLNIVDTGYDKKQYINSNTHCKFEVTSTGYKLYEDGVLVASEMRNLSNIRLSLYLSDTGDSMKYANFRIYSIFTVPKHYTPITLSSNKPMVDSMDSTILSAKLTNVVGGAVTNTNVDFLENDDLYGADVSDNNGVANLELSNDAIGKRIFKAVSSTVESEELVMWDTLFNDMGTIEHHNDEIWNDTTYLTRGTEYSTFFNENGNAIPYFEVSGDISIEFDIMTDMSASAGLFMIRKDTATRKQVTLSNLGLSNDTFHHIIIKIKNDIATISNTTNTNTITATVTDYNRFCFRSASNYRTSFKNLVIYLNE